MMEHLDTSWCPVCDRQILPKRYTVPAPPAAPPPPAAPAPPPSSPSKRAKSAAPTRRGGLVHGTGRVKANGALKAADKRTTSPKSSSAATAKAASAAPATAAASAPVKQRTVIDQAPTPLYCSDECRLADLQQSEYVYDYSRSYGFDHDGRLRASPPLHRRSPSAPVDLPQPHPRTRPSSPSASSSCTSASPSSSSSSGSAASTSSGLKSIELASSYSELDPSLARLASHYGFPSLPPPPPLLPAPPAPHPDAQRPPAERYQSGIMMAGERIKSALSPPSEKKKEQPLSASPTARLTARLQQRDRKPIPGWTDGTDAWRSSVYSLSPAGSDPERAAAAYGGFVASPHRSGGVQSTVSTSEPFSSTSTSLPSTTMDETFVKASSPTISRRPAPQSLPSQGASITACRRREGGILPPSAEGRLLVPNIKMRRTNSAASITSVSSAGVSSYGASVAPRSGRPLMRRMSAMSDEGNVIEEEGVWSAQLPQSASVPAMSAIHPLLAPPVRAAPKQRDADEILFAIIPRPFEIRTRVERRVGEDGVEREVKVQYEVPKEMKRLFLGPNGKSEARERMKRERAAAEACAAPILSRA